jgi:transposase-like protein
MAMAMIHSSGASFEQVADELGVDRGTVRYYSNKHRDKLRQDPEYSRLYDLLRSEETEILKLIKLI